MIMRWTDPDGEGTALPTPRRATAGTECTPGGGPLGAGWRLTHLRLDLVRGTPFETAGRRLLDSLEEGWGVVASLETPDSFGETRDGRADTDDARSPGPERAVAWLEWFAEMYVVDPYRDLLLCCSAYVLGSEDSGTPDLLEVLGTAEHLVRCYQVLLLASGHPSVPQDVRGRIEGAERLGPWLDGFEAAFTPFAEMIDGAE
jgi:hypothetical protein